MQVIETRKRVLREEHPSTLTSMNNLAFTLKGQGRLNEAISLIGKYLEVAKQVFGPQHPNVLSSIKALNVWQKENVGIRL